MYCRQSSGRGHSNGFVTHPLDPFHHPTSHSAPRAGARGKSDGWMIETCPRVSPGLVGITREPKYRSQQTLPHERSLKEDKKMTFEMIRSNRIVPLCVYSKRKSESELWSAATQTSLNVSFCVPRAGEEKGKGIRVCVLLSVRKPVPSAHSSFWKKTNTQG
jgi:hypothetical protein